MVNSDLHQTPNASSDLREYFPINIRVNFASLFCMIQDTVEISCLKD